MKQHYADILDALGEPKWWTEDGTPRYCHFEPVQAANIYADQVMLVRIECQWCGHAFFVCYSSTRHDTLLEDREDLEQYLRETVLDPVTVDLGEGRSGRRHFGYGDPPNINCCPAGPTMNAVPCQIVEFWRRNHDGTLEDGWQRVPDYEIDVTPEWAKPPTAAPSPLPDDLLDLLRP